MNLTPFIGVVMTLVIVMMVVAAPQAVISVPLSFLYGDEGYPQSMPEPVYVSLRQTGVIYVGSDPNDATTADWNSFEATLRAKTNGDKRRQIMIRADKEVPYADVLRLTDAINRFGYKNLVLVTESVEG
jgi:biopolymer transport protein ExbD